METQFGSRIDSLIIKSSLVFGKRILGLVFSYLDASVTVEGARHTGSFEQAVLTAGYRGT